MKLVLSRRMLAAAVLATASSAASAQEPLHTETIVAESVVDRLAPTPAAPGLAVPDPAVPGTLQPEGFTGFPTPVKIPAPAPGSDLIPPYMASTTYEHNQAPMEGVIGTHHGRAWMYIDGKHHGYPYYKSAYLPRAAGASYNFGQWVPRRSYYVPYHAAMRRDAPYGFSPEPYYFQSEIPAPVPPAEVDASRRAGLLHSWLFGGQGRVCKQCGCVHGS